MKITKKLSLLLSLLSLLASDTIANTYTLSGSSFFMPRSQSSDAARALTGTHRYINLYNQQKVYGVFNATPEYTGSTRPERIAQAIFGEQLLYVSGSEVSMRGENDILADFFGLSPTFQSTVCVKPRIRNALVDLQAYVGWKDFYFQVHAPVVWTQWDLGLDETVTGSTSPYPAGYMAATSVAAPASSFKQALQGNTTFGDMTTPLKAGLVCGKQTTTALAEIQGALGWNFINREHGHAGLNIRFGIPTGTRPNGHYLFEPVVGNGRHGELGVGFTGRTLIWEKDGEQELSFFADVNLIHQFASEQCRSFDFCSTTSSNSCSACCDYSCCPTNFGSRYILLKEFDSTGNSTGNLIPAINVTTVKANISVDIQMDFVAMFGYTYNNFVFDIGYNGWLRSKEKAEIKGCIPESTYGFKGIQDVAAPDTNTTQSTATWYGNLLTKQATVADTNSPIFVPKLNPSSAQSLKMITHKLFTYFGYQWKDVHSQEKQLVPFIGIGGAIEFEGDNPRGMCIDHNTTLNQWMLWLKGGVAF